MKADLNFTDILTASARGWCERRADEFVLSLAVPIQPIDPLTQLPQIAEQQQFRFLWDCAPGLSWAASGKCQHLDLAGPRRFDLAQRFSDFTLGRLIDACPNAPGQILPRVLFLFSFFDQPAERRRDLEASSSVQAVLPRW